MILGFAAMFKMAGPSMAEDMKLYQNALADMNSEAVEVTAADISGSWWAR